MLITYVLIKQVTVNQFYPTHYLHQLGQQNMLVEDLAQDLEAPTKTFEKKIHIWLLFKLEDYVNQENKRHKLKHINQKTHSLNYLW